MMVTVLCFIFAVICLVISVLQFKEKGFCFNNAYLLASPEERKKMNKSPHYRQSAIVFAGIFLMFLLIGIYGIVEMKPIIILAEIIAAVVLLYAIISSIKSGKNN